MRFQKYPDTCGRGLNMLNGQNSCSSSVAHPEIPPSLRLISSYRNFPGGRNFRQYKVAQP